MPLLLLSSVTQVPVPNGTVFVRVTEVFDSVARRAVSSNPTVARFTSFLPNKPAPFVDVANAASGWNPTVCEVPFQNNCVWNGGEVDVEYIAVNATVLGSDTMAFPPVCNVSLSNFTTDDNLTWCGEIGVTGDSGEVVTVFSGARFEPGFFNVIKRSDSSASITINLTETTTVCGLEASAEYFAWVGGEVAECRVAVTTPQLPIQNAPVVDLGIPLSVGPTAISFFFVVPNQTATVENIVVTYTDKTTNITREQFWTSAQSQVVPTVHPGMQFIVYRTFIVIPATVFPNTEYDLRVAIADSRGTKITPDSGVLTQATAASKQKKPSQPLVVSINNTVANVAFDMTDFREYGKTTHIVFREYILSETSLEGTLIAAINCSGVCPGGINVSRGDGQLLFITVAVVNQFGESIESDTSTIPAAVVEPDGNGLSAWAITGIAIGIGVVFLIILVVRGQSRYRVVVWSHPTADPEIELDRSQVTLSNTIGKGFTATVHAGTLTAEENEVRPVAIKQLKPGAPVEQRDGFVREIQTLSALRHHNVVRMIGAVTQGDPMMIVMEHCVHGAVNKYVQNHNNISTEQLFDWCDQMYRSVVYIHSRNILHRDIACRNFLLTENLNVKMCDFGLCKDVDIDAYYQRKDMDIAVRWAAPQTLFRRRDGAVRFSFGTDTWSLCVAFQEVYTGGAIPYAHIQSNEEVLERIVLGERLTPPDAMPDPLRGACVALFGLTDVGQITVDQALGKVFLAPIAVEEEYYEAQSSDSEVTSVLI